MRRLANNNKSTRRTVKVKIVHGSEVSLRLATDEPYAVGLSAVAYLRVVTISVDVVVEGQFLVLLDQAVRKDAHSNPVANGPLCDIAVRITTVVSEPTDTTALSCVDVLQTYAQYLSLWDSQTGIPRPFAAS